MSFLQKVRTRLRSWLTKQREARKPGSETDKATSYWAELEDYHLTNDEQPISIARSKWLAAEVVAPLGITSLLEVGCNSGRNLRYLKDAFPDMDLKGIDVNERALELARSTKPDITFELADANSWGEPAGRWGSALTMSVIDHMPAEAVQALASNLKTSCDHVITVELWDGHDGETGLYKYSYDLKSLFESHGFTTLRWERIPNAYQYDEAQSPLWLYVGSSK